MRSSPAHCLVGTLVALVACTKAPTRDLVPPPTVPTLPTVPETPIRVARPAESVVRPRAGLDPASVAVLEQAIGSSDYATRLIAVEAVGDTHAEALLGWLEHALGDPEHDVRMAAVEALDRIHSPRAGGLLATVRDDTTEELDIRAVAAGALLRMTPERQETR